MASSHLSSVQGPAGCLDIRCLEAGDADIVKNADLRITGFKDGGKVLVKNPDADRFNHLDNKSLKSKLELDGSINIYMKLQNFLKEVLSRDITDKEFLDRLFTVPRNTTAEQICEKQLTLEEFMKRVSMTQTDIRVGINELAFSNLMVPVRPEANK